MGPRAAGIGQTLQQMLGDGRTDVIILAVRSASRETIFNPRPEIAVAPGDTLFVMGERPRLTAIEHLLTP